MEISDDSTPESSRKASVVEDDEYIDEADEMDADEVSEETTPREAIVVPGQVQPQPQRLVVQVPVTSVAQNAVLTPRPDSMTALFDAIKVVEQDVENPAKRQRIGPDPTNIPMYLPVSRPMPPPPNPQQMPYGYPMMPFNYPVNNYAYNPGAVAFAQAQAYQQAMSMAYNPYAMQQAMFPYNMQ